MFAFFTSKDGQYAVDVSKITVLSQYRLVISFRLRDSPHEAVYKFKSEESAKFVFEKLARMITEVVDDRVETFEMPENEV